MDICKSGCYKICKQRLSNNWYWHYTHDTKKVGWQQAHMQANPIPLEIKATPQRQVMGPILEIHKAFMVVPWQHAQQCHMVVEHGKTIVSPNLVWGIQLIDCTDIKDTFSFLLLSFCKNGHSLPFLLHFQRPHFIPEFDSWLKNKLFRIYLCVRDRVTHVYKFFY